VTCSRDCLAVRVCDGVSQSAMFACASRLVIALCCVFLIRHAYIHTYIHTYIQQHASVISWSCIECTKVRFNIYMQSNRKLTVRRMYPLTLCYVSAGNRLDDFRQLARRSHWVEQLLLLQRAIVFAILSESLLDDQDLICVVPYPLGRTAEGVCCQRR
jgi:hypothetical protein